MVSVESTRIEANAAAILADGNCLRTNTVVVSDVHVVHFEVVLMDAEGSARVVGSCSACGNASLNRDLVGRVGHGIGCVSVNLIWIRHDRETVYKHTVRGPARVMYTCSLYVPGYMKIEREELSLGSAATADATVLYSPEVDVPARTTIAPDGGEVREAASTAWHRDNPMINEHKR